MIDELSLGLAPKAIEALTEALGRIRAEGVSILLVEQDVLAALELADRAFVIDRGRVLVSGAGHRDRPGSEGARGLSRRGLIDPAGAS